MVLWPLPSSSLPPSPSSFPFSLVSFSAFSPWHFVSLHKLLYCPLPPPQISYFYFLTSVVSFPLSCLAPSPPCPHTHDPPLAPLCLPMPPHDRNPSLPKVAAVFIERYYQGEGDSRSGGHAGAALVTRRAAWPRRHGRTHMHRHARPRTLMTHALP